MSKQQQQQAEGTAPKHHPRTPVSHPEKRDREVQLPLADKQHHHGRQAAEQGDGPVRCQQTGQGLDFDSATSGETRKRRDGQKKPVLRPR